MALDPRKHDEAGAKRLAAAALAVAGAIVLSIALLHPLSTAPATSLYDASTFGGAFLNQPDVTLNAWILAWGTHALATGRIADFFDANIFHPAEASLALSEHMIGALPTFAPLYLATERLALSHNVWLVVTFALCALAAYFVALRWLGSHAAAAVAGVGWGFAPWRFAELAHVQVLSVQFLPLLVYALWRTRERRDVATWVCLAGLVWMQALCSFYLGYMAFLLAAVSTPILLLFQPEGRAARFVFVATALLAAAAAMLPFTWPYLELPEGRELAKWWFAADVTEQAATYLAPPLAEQGVAPWRPWLAVPVLAVPGAVLGLRSAERRPWVAALLAVGALGLVLGNLGALDLLGIEGPEVDALLARLLPGWEAVRVLSRFNVLLWLCLSLLCAVPFAAAEGRPSAWRSPRAIAATVLVIALAASAWRVDLRTIPAPETREVAAAHRWLAEHGGSGPLLVWPTRYAQEDSDAGYLTTLHWLPLVNGYSGYQPPWYPMIVELARSLPEADALDTLVSLNLARWLLVRSGPAYRRARGWDRLPDRGMPLRSEGPGYALYELPHRPDRPGRVVAPPGRSLLGTPIAPLEPAALRGDVRPMRRRARRNLSVVALPVGWDVRNDSTSPWPAIAPEDAGLVGLRFRLRREDGSQKLSGFVRLGSDLAPGETTRVWSAWPPITEPGRYQVVPCLTQSGGDVMNCFEESSLWLHAELAPPKEAAR